MKIGSLFAGIGGFDLAARWMGWKTAWFSEIDPYASAVLRKHWPDVPNHGDITQIKGSDVEPVDLLCGGFPCQDISTAGKGAGIEGSRSGLWSHYARLIDEIRPSWVIAENVSVLRSRGLDRVLKDLAALGYDAEWHCIPASAVGAPHRRDRIWIIAYPNTDGTGSQRRNSPILRECPDERTTRKMGALADSDSGRRDAQPLRCSCAQERHCPSHADSTSTTIRGSSQWFAEPDVGRVVNGVPSRVDRLKCLGNAIVPQVAYFIFKAIAAEKQQ